MSGLMTVRRLLLLLIVVAMLFGSDVIAHVLTQTIPIVCAEQINGTGIPLNNITPTPVPPSTDNQPLQYTWISVLLCMVGLNILTIIVALGFKRRFESISPEKK